MDKLNAQAASDPTIYRFARLEGEMKAARRESKQLALTAKRLPAEREELIGVPHEKWTLG